MIRRCNWLTVLTFTLVLVFSGCDTEDPLDSAARIRIKLTDAGSLVIRELHIELTEIAVFTTDSADASGEWVTLEYSGGKYNLLKLMNGKTVQLVDQYFPSYKNIEKIRLRFGNENSILTVTNNDIPLQLSPDIIDGVEIDMSEFELMPHVISYIIIDINAAFSINESNGNWFLNPAARAFPENWGGSITGYVAPLEASPSVAVAQNDKVYFTFPEMDGMFKFIGLEEGEWEIHLMAHPESIYADTVIVDTLEAGEKKVLNPKPIRLPLKANGD